MNKLLSVTVDVDDTILQACLPFDYKFEGTSTFTLPEFNAPKRDGSWAIGLIVGPSGSGKSHLLNSNYGITSEPIWDKNKAIASQVDWNKLSAVGLNSVPTWCRPYHVLSNGEQFRARMAKMLCSNSSFDEYTSVVDRTIAKGCAFAMQREIRSKQMTGVVLATCHYDVIEWLQPDWIFDTLKASLTLGRSLWQRPSISITIERCHSSLFDVFKKHHYMSDDINKASRCYSAKWDNNLIGFVSALPMPSGTLKNAWREHRVVVLPDYQGLGIGVRLSDAIAKIFTDEGKRYYSKTAHPRMGEYRNKSPLWRTTKKSRLIRLDYLKNLGGLKGDPKNAARNCYSHEFKGL
jgi:ABC-type lipoprotein export system ATPase subunit/GNAT superfamily N-acetyltransferase